MVQKLWGGMCRWRPYRSCSHNTFPHAPIHLTLLVINYTHPNQLKLTSYIFVTIEPYVVDTIRPECVCYSGSILDPVDLRWRCQVVFVSQPVDVCHRGCTYSAPSCSKAWSVQRCLWYCRL